ncbi:hypothetical protein ACMD2_24372 [Ananas comosus]|uniref:Uncharacterized protein n=1 Tax=Ananas comosus TaxID=4615 RepID=A0A199VWK8_ANACO|nr:hypothetical protein ACMD2_24372 [Ananas comosus]
MVESMGPQPENVFEFLSQGLVGRPSSSTIDSSIKEISEKEKAVEKIKKDCGIMDGISGPLSSQNILYMIKWEVQFYTRTFRPGSDFVWMATQVPQLCIKDALRYPTALNVIYIVWNQALLGLDASSHFAAKIKRPRALDSWSAGLTSAIKKQSNVCLRWIEWLDKSEETRPISNMESLL